MTKVGNQEDDVIYPGEHLIIRAIRTGNGSAPAKEFFDALDGRHKTKVLSAAESLETSWRFGRRDSRKWSKLTGHPLWEFRATPSGSSTTLRFYGIQEGRTILLAVGENKKRQKPSRTLIQKAIRIVNER